MGKGDRQAQRRKKMVGQTGLVLLGPTKASGIKFPSTFYGAAAQEYR